MILTYKMPKEQKEQLVYQVQHYFEMELGETIGNLAAEGMIDHMLQLLGPYLYNQGIADARNVLMQKTAQLEDELYALEKR